jgi:hypothetical protein
MSDFATHKTHKKWDEVMKKTISVILALILLLALVPTTVFATDYAKTQLATELASDLKELNLFKGVSDTDFALGRAPDRAEALTMMIRLLGKEDEALSGNWEHPFTDVPAWADKYVGYAYTVGLTNGVSATKFGTTNATAGMYLTFVLRALGYSDSDGDFTWQDPYTLASSLGLLPDYVNLTSFYRSDAVIISYAALATPLKGTTTTLATSLMDMGVFSAKEYESVYDTTALASYVGTKKLTSEEIYAYCTPAVFYIEIYDRRGSLLSTGSGFFIDSDGTAVTNYHVIEEAYSAKIALADSGKVYNVLGVYDYDATVDWAVIKVDGSGFSYLSIPEDTSTVVGGAQVYTIGSPLGLQSTMTHGIISNPARVDSGITYIQTDAPISHGSSGGALINEYGEVIGITSATYTYGSNLNLVLPITVIEGYSRANVTPLYAIR